MCSVARCAESCDPTTDLDASTGQGSVPGTSARYKRTTEYSSGSSYSGSISFPSRLRPFHLLSLPFVLSTPLYFLTFIMRAFTFVSFLTVALFGSQVMAAPMEPHMIAKREAICSANVRTISNNDCLQNNQGNNYTWTAPSNIAMKSVTVSLSLYFPSVQLADRSLTGRSFRFHLQSVAMHNDHTRLPLTSRFLLQTRSLTLRCSTRR